LKFLSFSSCFVAVVLFFFGLLFIVSVYTLDGDKPKYLKSECDNNDNLFLIINKYSHFFGGEEGEGGKGLEVKEEEKEE